MGREVKRVPLDFAQPLNQTWEGYLRPDSLDGIDCSACEGSGYSRYARHLQDKWYGNIPFDPAESGSTPLTATTPAVRRFAERNVSRSPWFYGTGCGAITQEASRLVTMWNGQWSHHLTQADVDALVAAGRLHDFTHDWTREGWRTKDPAPTVTSEQVNEWSLSVLSHDDSINCAVVVEARCAAAGLSDTCDTCGGYGTVEAHPGQRAAWERTDPPAGDGWQLWETVSEGSPISPVFPTAEGLADWLTTPAAEWGAGKPFGDVESALRFVKAGWAPSFVYASETGVIEGAEFAGLDRT